MGFDKKSFFVVIIIIMVMLIILIQYFGVSKFHIKIYEKSENYNVIIGDDNKPSQEKPTNYPPNPTHNLLNPIEKNTNDLHKTIAIGMGITSHRLPINNVEMTLSRLPLFRHLLPSFCRTLSTDWNYNFYFGYDKNDGFFTNDLKRNKFVEKLVNFVKSKCPSNTFISVHMVHCDHNGSPTRAQNDAMLEAYIDDNTYYYRVNDDTVMQTNGWVEEFVSVLNKYDPINVGVVGPHHKNGNTAILTYDFVHKTHVDIFGFYYPRVFTDWWGDDWITIVYRPGRSTKVENVKLLHTLDSGTRYNVHQEVKYKLKRQVDRDKVTLYRYIKAFSDNVNIKVNGGKYILMSLNTTSSKIEFYGVMRNAQLLRIYFPDWILRVYINKNLPERWINKLKILNVDVKFGNDSIKSNYWPFLAMNDENIDTFIIRNASNRFSERDAIAVNKWLESSSVFHCIRDHPRHSKYNIPGIGLIGGKRKKLLTLNQQPWNNLHLATNFSWIESYLYPAVKEDILCHDSFSCKSFPNTEKYPIVRFGKEFVGRKFDERMNPNDSEADRELLSGQSNDC